MKDQHKNQLGTILTIVLLLVCLKPNQGTSTDMDWSFQGEAALWSAAEDTPTDRRELGYRYLPELNLSLPLSDGLQLDGMIMGNLSGTAYSVNGSDSDTTHEEKPYRLWARLSSDQAGVRLGLQEISFGPGKILRSLRWFDQKDSRDPTGFTDGVNALLFRYYFESNANIWAWTMTGNEDPMGISLLNTVENSHEQGARVQLATGSAEIGLSLHHRQAEPYAYPGVPAPASDELQENRIGFDLTWDLGIGLYLESTYLELEENGFIPESQLFLTLGCDYTFDIGNGLGSIVEVMGVDLRYNNQETRDGTVWLLAVSEQISLNLLDQVGVLALRNFDTEITTLQASWARTTDNWVFTLMGYTSDTGSGEPESSPFSFSSVTGQQGVRLLVQYNH